MNAQLFAIALPALLLAWANGANDVSKGVATLIASALAKPTHAILWGTLWTVVGIATRWGLPVSTTHGNTGSLMGVRFTDRSAPVQADALKAILIAWLVTLPVAALIASAASRLLGSLF